MNCRVIAIDGPAGAGKSTVARAVAERLGWSFLDTGAMYRAVTVLALEAGIDLSSDEMLEQVVTDLSISMTDRVVINGRDVTSEIRSPDVNSAVSAVAACSAIRRALVEQQRIFASEQPLGTVVEGRDITTVVFADAEVRVFLTASLEERAKRRGDESAASVAARDNADASRADSPLSVGDGVTILDTTNMPLDQVVDEVVACLRK
jgi:cytidylate kinase